MEIYMTTEHGISAVEATNISIQNFIFYQTALVIYGVLAVSYNFIFHIFPKTELLRKNAAILMARFAKAEPENEQYLRSLHGMDVLLSVSGHIKI